MKKAIRMAKKPSHTLDLSKVNGLPLQRVLQLVCETGSPKDACSLLRTCKWIRTAAQHSCTGLVPIECSPEPQQIFAVAAWLRHNLSLARSLSIGGRQETPYSQEKQAAVSALALALQTGTSVCLISSCCLAGLQYGEILQQLPSHHLTSLQISLSLPSNAAVTDDQLQHIAAALSQLQQLESAELSLSQLAVGDQDIGYDCLLTAVSDLSKLTSLKLHGVSNDAEMRCLPNNLKVVNL